MNNDLMNFIFELLTATALGILEGLTEFIPVSSTGHLVLLGSAIGFSGPKAELFEIFIQLGAILAVVIIYRERFVSLFRSSLKSLIDSPLLSFVAQRSSLKWMISKVKEDTPKHKNTLEVGSNIEKGGKDLQRLAVACIPVIIVGGLIHKHIHLLMKPAPVAIALILGGIAMILLDNPKRTVTTDTLDSITLGQALKIGIFQCLSLWPGISRSGSTIIGGLLCGCSRTAAAEFSFLVAVPVMCVAVGFKMITEFHSLTIDDLPTFAVGFVVAYLVAVFAIRFFLGLLQRVGLRPFGIYRIILGLLVLLLVR